MSTRTAHVCLFAAVSAIAAVASGPVSNAEPIPQQCYQSPLDVRCLGPRSSADFDCQIIPPGPQCVVSTLPPGWPVPAQLPDGEWALLIPAGPATPAVHQRTVAQGPDASIDTQAPVNGSS